MFRVALPSGGAVLFVVGERTSNIDAFADRIEVTAAAHATRGNVNHFDVGNASRNATCKGVAKAFCRTRIVNAAYGLLRRDFNSAVSGMSAML